MPVSEFVFGRPIKWEYRPEKSVGEVAREIIRDYFSKYSNSSDENSIFAIYEKNPSLFERILYGSKKINNRIWNGEHENEIKIVSITKPLDDQKKIPKSVDLRNYLDNAHSVYLKFYGVPYESKAIEYHQNTTRIGNVIDDFEFV